MCRCEFECIAPSDSSLTDPFEEYKKRLAVRLAKEDKSEEAQRRRAEKAAERDKDRTTWLGTDLGVKGESATVREERKRKADDGVGKYLNAGVKAKPATPPIEFGVEKKKRKGGGFGDFSGW